MSTAEHAETNRRDFLYIATGAVGAVGAALAVWPFINQMNPDASVLALASVEVDLAPIAEGQEITIKWRGNPVFIRHRLPVEIEAAKAVQMGELKDPLARNANLPESDPTKMDFGGDKSKAWKDIWGCGQGIGAITKIQSTADYVAQLKREYATARARLLVPV